MPAKEIDLKHLLFQDYVEQVELNSAQAAELERLKSELAKAPPPSASPAPAVAAKLADAEARNSALQARLDKLEAELKQRQSLVEKLEARAKLLELKARTKPCPDCEALRKELDRAQAELTAARRRPTTPAEDDGASIAGLRQTIEALKREKANTEDRYKFTLREKSAEIKQLKQKVLDLQDTLDQH